MTIIGRTDSPSRNAWRCSHTPRMKMGNPMRPGAHIPINAGADDHPLVGPALSQSGFVVVILEADRPADAGALLTACVRNRRPRIGIFTGPTSLGRRTCRAE